MRAVIDTNVIVSGLLNPYGIPAEILRLLLAGEIILIYDSRIISEYQEVLSRSKFQFIIENIKILVKEIEVTGSLVLPVSLKFSLPDPDDNMFLEAAIADEADCIITGNKSYFPKKLCSGIKVFSPSEFIVFYRRSR